jgi:hypothetical protein
MAIKYGHFDGPLTILTGCLVCQKSHFSEMS